MRKIAPISLLLVFAWSLAAQAVQSGESTEICRAAITRAEKRFAIPRQLLSAISVAESGRWDEARQATIAWPWTVYAEGRGRYLPSKAAAIAEVRALRARGVRNIDVGCMQINLGYHSTAFASQDEAFNPDANATYAARFLKRLYKESRSWSMAIAYFHSRTDALNRPYRVKVLRLWDTERRRVAQERRRQLNAELQRRRIKLAQLRQSRLVVRSD